MGFTDWIQEAVIRTEYGGPPETWPPPPFSTAALSAAHSDMVSSGHAMTEATDGAQRAASGLFDADVWRAGSSEAAAGLLQRFGARGQQIASHCSLVARVLAELQTAMEDFLSARATAARQADEIFSAPTVLSMLSSPLPGLPGADPGGHNPPSGNDPPAAELEPVFQLLFGAHRALATAQRSAAAAFNGLVDSLPADPVTAAIADNFHIRVDDRGQSSGDVGALREVTTVLASLNSDNAARLQSRGDVHLAIAPDGSTVCDLPGFEGNRDKDGSCSAAGLAILGAASPLLVGVSARASAVPADEFPDYGHPNGGVVAHETGHLVQNSMSSDQSAALTALFDQRKRDQGYFVTDYSRESSNEYFAESTRAFFNTSYSPAGVDPSIASREQMRARDPQLYAFLSTIYSQAPY